MTKTNLIQPLFSLSGQYTNNTECHSSHFSGVMLARKL